MKQDLLNLTQQFLEETRMDRATPYPEHPGAMYFRPPTFSDFIDWLKKTNK